MARQHENKVGEDRLPSFNMPVSVVTTSTTPVLIKESDITEAASDAGRKPAVVFFECT